MTDWWEDAPLAGQPQLEADKPAPKTNDWWMDAPLVGHPQPEANKTEPETSDWWSAAPLVQSAQDEMGFFETAGTAAMRGAVRGALETGQSLTEPFSGRALPQEANDIITRHLQTPIDQGWTNPNWWAANMAYGAGHSSPSLALGAVGTAAGVPGGLPGMAVGGGIGFGAGSLIQTLAPSYQRARQRGLEHDAAVDHAIKETGISTAIGTIMGAAPGIGFLGKTAEGALKKPISEALLQVFGVQPALSTAQITATTGLEGRQPTFSELAHGAAMQIGVGAPLVGAHAAVRSAAGVGRPITSPEDVMRRYLNERDQITGEVIPPEGEAPRTPQAPRQIEDQSGRLAYDITPEEGAEAAPFEMPRAAEKIDIPETDTLVQDLWSSAEFVREMRSQKRPQSLVDWIHKRGGIKDEGQEVRHIMGAAKQRPGLINKKGERLDDLALKAWEEGFIASSRRPTIAEFLDLIDEDLRGNRIVRLQDQEALADFDRYLPYTEEQLALYDIRNAKTPADVARQLADYFRREPEAYAEYRAQRSDRGPGEGEGVYPEGQRAQASQAEKTRLDFEKQDRDQANAEAQLQETGNQPAILPAPAPTTQPAANIPRSLNPLGGGGRGGGTGGGGGGAPPWRSPGRGIPTQPALPPGTNAQARRMAFMDTWRTALIEKFQDSTHRVRKLQEAIANGVQLPDYMDTWLKATLYYGRVDTKIRRTFDAAKLAYKDMGKLAALINRPLADAKQLVNDWMLATHAPERNSWLGDGAAGITNAEATQLRAALSQLPRDVQAQIQYVADLFQTLNRHTLEALRDAGVISQRLYQDLRQKYPNHVPLQRIFEGDDIGSTLMAKGFDVYATGLKRAKGSDLPIHDLMETILLNHEQAILRAEKNLVDQSTLAFVRHHAQDLQGIARVRRTAEYTNDPRVLHLYEDGKKVQIFFNDVRLAAAYKAVNREVFPVGFRFIAAVTRLYASLATRFNPEFALPNKLRDLQEAMVYMAAQGKGGAKGAGKLAARDAQSIRDVAEFLWKESDPNAQLSPGAQAYRDMLEAGGTTGGMGLSTRAQIKIRVTEGFWSLEKLAQHKPRAAAEKAVHYIDNLNRVFEDSTRLSVYKTALEQGMSRDRAAFHAKEASVNFNRLGTAGPIINSLYMFSNASIQGSVKMLRSLKNPKVLMGVSATALGATAGISKMNDAIDPDWRNKVSKWDRLNSLNIVLPTDEGVKYFAIPVGWGLKPIFVAAQQIVDAMSGEEVDIVKNGEDIITSIAEAYNPVGGTNLGQVAAPSIIDPVVDIYAGRKWHGGPMHPDYDPNMPESRKYFLRQRDTTLGAAAIKATDFLSDYTRIEISPADLAYAIEQYSGGVGRFAGKTTNVLSGLITDPIPPPEDAPIISRFYRARTQEELGRGASGEIRYIKKGLAEQSRERFDEKARAHDFMRDIKDLDPEQKAARFEQLKAIDPGTAEKAAKMIDKKAIGLTYEESQIKRFGVENKERAKYLVKRLDGLHIKERNKLIHEWRKKKIITPEVLRQMRQLQRGQNIRQRKKRIKTPDFTPAP